jgi:hypothetical protein
MTIYKINVFNQKAVLPNGATCSCFEVFQETEDFNQASLIARQKRIEIFGDRPLRFAESVEAPYVSSEYRNA